MSSWGFIYENQTTKTNKNIFIEEFGKEQALKLFDKEEKLLNELIENTTDKSKNQMKTLVQTILPRIALYKTLIDSNYSALWILVGFCGALEKNKRCKALNSCGVERKQ